MQALFATWGRQGNYFPRSQRILYLYIWRWHDWVLSGTHKCLALHCKLANKMCVHVAAWVWSDAMCGYINIRALDCAIHIPYVYSTCTHMSTIQICKYTVLWDQPITVYFSEGSCSTGTCPYCSNCWLCHSWKQGLKGATRMDMAPCC